MPVNKALAPAVNPSARLGLNPTLPLFYFSYVLAHYVSVNLTSVTQCLKRLK